MLKKPSCLILLCTVEGATRKEKRRSMMCAVIIHLQHSIIVLFFLSEITLYLN